MQEETKQARRIPSAVDVAFTLFGKKELAQVLARRMEATADDDDAEFVPRRDGIPFASNLIALRQVIDEEFNDSDEDRNSSRRSIGDESETVGPQLPATIPTTEQANLVPEDIAINDSSSSEGCTANENESVKGCDSDSGSCSTENESISTLWLRALRALSRPSSNTDSTFHSGTWQRRQMNTQIASFSQLRHDTVLYSKKSSSRKTQCEYPDGLVDPYPVFWRRMRELAERAKAIVKDAHMEYASELFENFASTTKILEDISVRQAAHEQLKEGEVDFMKSVMEIRHRSGMTRYNGWYPELFYASRDVLVMDVHTDDPSTEHGDPGCELHLGVGDPFVVFVIVNNVMYAGPVFSSYEFVEPTNVRLTDDEFQSKLSSMRAPHWARQSYLSDKCEIASKKPSRNPPQVGNNKQASTIGSGLIPQKCP